MRIALHIPVWKRLDLTRACYEGLKRNIKEFQELGFDLIPYIAYSEKAHGALADEYGWKKKWIKNDRLGTKNQALYEWMKKDEWEWFMQLGSDDFLLPGGAEVIVENMAQYKFACFDSLFFFQKDTRLGTELKGYRCGAGRYIHRSIVDRVDLMWNDRVKGCDGYSAGRVHTLTGERLRTMKGTYIADVKSDINVTQYFQATPEIFEMDGIIPEAELI